MTNLIGESFVEHTNTRGSARALSMLDVNGTVCVHKLVNYANFFPRQNLDQRTTRIVRSEACCKQSHCECEFALVPTSLAPHAVWLTYIHAHTHDTTCKASKHDNDDNIILHKCVVLRPNTTPVMPLIGNKYDANKRKLCALKLHWFSIISRPPGDGITFEIYILIIELGVVGKLLLKFRWNTWVLFADICLESMICGA